MNWDGAFGLDVRTQEMQQLDQVMKRSYTFRGDHSQELLSNNTGPTAIETLLAALGACMAGTFAAQATARGVQLDELELDPQAGVDLNGFFELQSVHPGLSDVKLSYRVKSDADERVLDEIAEAAKAHSPVFDSMTRSIESHVAMNKM